MKRVLLTGATGFIGRHAGPALEERGFEVHQVGIEDGDLLDPSMPAELVARIEPTHLLHLAWCAVGDFWTSPENLRWVEATLRLMHALSERGDGARVVVAGSSAEYDWTGGGRLVEDVTPERPATLYGAAKHAVGTIGRRLDGLSYAHGRVFFVYGPGEDERRLVPVVARSLLAGERAAVSEGTQVRDFIHAADVAGALVALLDSDVRGPVNIASGDPLPVRDIVAMVADAAGRPELVDYGAMPTRPGDPPELIPDVTRLRDEVGFTPIWSTAAGLADAVSSWRA